MAEAIVNHHYGERWRAVSAGTRPVGRVHPLTIEVLREIGVDIAGARSKSVDELRGRDFDIVVTVCDAAAEDCPFWPGSGTRLHCGFPDPARVGGTADEMRQAFRAVRDAIAAQIGPLLEAHTPGL